jgi:hypothetical protein
LRQFGSALGQTWTYRRRANTMSPFSSKIVLRETSGQVRFRADSRLEQSIVAAIKAIRVAFLILHALTHAIAAAAHGSFRQAAEVLSIKQPIPQPASALSARGQ